MRDLTIAEALLLFGGVPAARERLALMVETGLGYLQLGQPASTFSRGEAQRVKLARALARRATGRTHYLPDQPTTGRHPADTAHLLRLLPCFLDPFWAIGAARQMINPAISTRTRQKV